MTQRLAAGHAQSSAQETTHTSTDHGSMHTRKNRKLSEILRRMDEAKGISLTDEDGEISADVFFYVVKPDGTVECMGPQSFPRSSIHCGLLQDAVEGYFELVLDDGHVLMFGNEEGQMLGLEPNHHASELFKMMEIPSHHRLSPSRVQFLGNLAIVIARNNDIDQ